MNSRIVSELINLAQTSTMTSRHAAAIVSSKRILSIATNYSLPSGDAVDMAYRESATTKRSRFGCGGEQNYTSNAIESNQRVQGSVFNAFSQKVQRVRSRSYGERAVERFRYEKDGTTETEDSACWVSAGKACRGECFAQVSL